MEKQQKTFRKTRKTKLAREYTPYCIEIKEWTTPYSLYLNTDKKYWGGPYWEHLELKIRGDFIYPNKFVGKSVEVVFLGDRQKTQMLNDPDKYDDYKPLCLGSFTLRGERREYLGSLPIDSFPAIIGTLASQKYKFLIFHGYTSRYGSAEIFSVHIYEEFNKEDWW